LSIDAADDKIATVQEDAVKVWNVNSGEVVCAVEPGFPNSVALSPSGKLLVLGTKDAPIVCNSQTGSLIRMLPPAAKGSIHFVSSKQIAACHNENSISLWNLNTGKELARVEVAKHKDDSIHSADYSLDGKMAATVTFHRLENDRNAVDIISLWNLVAKNVKEIDSIALPESISCIALSPDASLIACGLRQSLGLWNTKSGKKVASVHLEGRQLNTLAFTNDGAKLAGASAANVKIWNVEDLITPKATGAPASSFEIPPETNIAGK